MRTDFQANVSLWQNCNLKCAYCFARPIAPPRQWSEEVDQSLIDMADFFAATGTWSLEISGGEPTIHPGFPAWTTRLAEDGHLVHLVTNGVTRLWELYPDGDVSSLDAVTFSFHPTHDRRHDHRETFERNIEHCRSAGVGVWVNHVMYPDHQSTPEEIREAFGHSGINLRFHPLQGEADGRQYPGAYTAEEITDFERFGDIRARYLMEHGFFRPTGRRCRAGFETFYVSMRTGGVYVCEQLQQRPLANFADPDAAEVFRIAVAPEPTVCPATRCTCRLTVDQERFLETHDKWDMANYEAWERISTPAPGIDEGIAALDAAFAAELEGRLAGGGLAIWAAGVHTTVLLRRLAAHGFPMDRIVAIVDTERFKQGRDLHGHTVVSPDDFVARHAAQCSDILVSSRAFEAEISTQLGERFGDRFSIIQLYDGSFATPYEYLDAATIADLTASDVVDVTAPAEVAGPVRVAAPVRR